jgi:hypothetical protein
MTIVAFVQVNVLQSIIIALVRHRQACVNPNMDHMIVHVQHHHSIVEQIVVFGAELPDSNVNASKTPIYQETNNLGMIAFVKNLQLTVEPFTDCGM